MNNKLTFEQIYNMYHSDILGYVTYATGNKDIAEEITNDTFLKSAKYEFDAEKSNIRTWLRKIANGVISDYYRVDKSKYNQNISDFQDENGNEFFTLLSDSDASSEVESNELMTTINKAFSSLKPKYRQIADLFFMQELSHAEICEICQLPLNTVKVMILRCKAMLQTQLQTESQMQGIKVGN